MSFQLPLNKFGMRVDPQPTLIVADEPLVSDEPTVEEESELVLDPQPRSGKLTLKEITAGAKSALPVLIRRFGSLLLAFVGFYALADYTSFTVAQLRPGEMIFSNTMIQLWTATYRLAYVYIVVLGLLTVTAPVLWALYRPDGNAKFDLSAFVLNHLSPSQQVWLFFAVFYSNCVLFILLLMVKLPQSVESVTAGP